MQKQPTHRPFFDSLFEAFTAPYTQMYKLNSISLPDLKMVIRNGNQVVIENGILKNSKEVPTHEIIMLEGTTANTKFAITAKNLSTGETETINF